MIDTRTTANRYVEPEQWQNYLTIKIKSNDLQIWWDMFKLAGRIYVDFVKAFTDKQIIIKYNIMDEDEYQPYLKVQTYVESNGAQSLALLIDTLSIDYCIESGNKLSDSDKEDYLKNDE